MMMGKARCFSHLFMQVCLFVVCFFTFLFHFVPHHAIMPQEEKPLRRLEKCVRLV